MTAQTIETTQIAEVGNGVGKQLPTVPTVKLVPFPAASLPDAWRWLQQAPRCNFDDYAPRNLEQFLETMVERQKAERIMGAELDGKLVGIISYVPVTERTGMLHGVCFTKSVHGKGAAAAAMAKLFEFLEGMGVRKVSASYFADNGRARRFFSKLGAVDEGHLKAQTLRGGAPVNMRLVAFFLGGG